MDINTHTDALRIAERYGYGIFDALMVASALAANCSPADAKPVSPNQQFFPTYPHLSR